MKLDLVLAMKELDMLSTIATELIAIHQNLLRELDVCLSAEASDDREERQICLMVDLARGAMQPFSDLIDRLLVETKDLHEMIDAETQQRTLH